MSITITFKGYVLFFQRKDDHKKLSDDEKKMWFKLYSDINSSLNSYFESRKDTSDGANTDYIFFNGIYKLIKNSSRCTDEFKSRIIELTYISNSGQQYINEYINCILRNPSFTDPSDQKTMIYFMKLFIPIWFRWSNNMDECEDDIKLFNKLIKNKQIAVQ